MTASTLPAMADASRIEGLRGLLALAASLARARDDDLSGRGRARVDRARDARAFAESRRLVLDGPLVLLPPQVAGILSLALLATDAARHGALSAIKGRVALQWRLVGPHEECQQIP